MLTELHIGIDDTDSRLGGCTTYTATLIFQELTRRGFRPSDFPWLVRLNPNIPWKTRGNGALAIHLDVEEDEIDLVRDLTVSIVEDTTDTSISSTDPAVVVVAGHVPESLREFSSRALHDVLSIGEARRVAEAVGANLHLLRGARGLIGSLAAVGADLDRGEHTFELIAYRTRQRLGTPRRIDKESVRKMDLKYRDRTFSNLDPETGRVLISPHGPDPVLLGIRGRDPQSVMDAFREVKLDEPVERIMIFKTNHGTDAHLVRARSISELKPYQSAFLTGRVETMPRVLRGGHVIFRLEDETGGIDCAAYEPTGSLMMATRELLPGDRVKVCGGIRRRKSGAFTLNLEKLEIAQLMEAFREENPRCRDCGTRCESMGLSQGFRCRRCGLRLRNSSKNRLPVERSLRPSVYIAPPRARRHLTRPDPTSQTSDYFGHVRSSYSLESLLKVVQSASTS